MKIKQQVPYKHLEEYRVILMVINLFLDLHYRAPKCDVIKNILSAFSWFFFSYFGRAWWKTSTHQMEPGQFTLISMGLILYSCGHILGPHEPIPTKFGVWRFFIMHALPKYEKNHANHERKKKIMTSSLWYSIRFHQSSLELMMMMMMITLVRIIFAVSTPFLYFSCILQYLS